MTATSRAPRRPRIRARGPPPAPTPIRTARGARSAAADDRVLAEFLETSLRVPNLSLPPQNRKRFQFPPPRPDSHELPGVAANALLSGESSAAALISAAAAEIGGAFGVAGALGDDEVREAVRASEALFAAPEEVKREQLGRWFRRTDRVEGEEFCWFRPVSPDDDRALEAALHGSTYRVFRYVPPKQPIRVEACFCLSAPRSQPQLAVHSTSSCTAYHATLDRSIGDKCGEFQKPNFIETNERKEMFGNISTDRHQKMFP